MRGSSVRVQISARLRRLRAESGSMLIELLIAMTFLAVAVGALLSVYSSSVVTLRHASIEGNALALVDKQMETFKTLPYSGLALTSGSIPSSGLYVSSPPSNLTASQQASITSGQTTGGSVPATQTVTGPDNRTYRVDSYVFSNAGDTSYDGYIQVTIAVRLVTSGTAGSVRAQATSAFNAASTQAPAS